MPRRSRPVLLLLLLTTAAACAADPPPAPVAAPPTPSAAPAARLAMPPVTPALRVLLRPTREPSALVHVKLALDTDVTDLATWHFMRGDAASVGQAVAKDATGPVPVKVVSTAAAGDGGVDLVLERAPKGHVELEYDVTATASTTDSSSILIRGDRFRGSGERLIALPSAALDVALPVTLDLDLGALEADKGASSFGVGAHRTAKMRPRALHFAEILVGAHDDMTMDTIDGHDEASWVGTPAFDMREAVVELAQERTIMAGILGGRALLPDVPWTYLFEVSTATKPGAFRVTPRIDSLFVQLASTETMSVPLRMALARPLARRWIGDAIRFAPSGHPPELAWFDEGIAEYLSLRALARVGVLAAADWTAVIEGDFSVLATSKFARLGNADLAALSRDEPEAFGVLVARGALYAARESARISASTHGARDMEKVLAALLERAKGGRATGYQALAAGDWVDELSKSDPEAAKSFAGLVLQGGALSLPEGALGPCFRAGVGEYVAFDAGLDVEATKASADHHPVGLRQGGPAAKAGLRADDTVDEVTWAAGDVSHDVVIIVARAGKKTRITYAPRGRTGRGQTWSRVRGVPDSQCGLPP